MEMANPSSDCEEVQVEAVVESHQVQFLPLDSSQRDRICKRLGMKNRLVGKELPHSNVGEFCDGAPSKIKKIEGDGNCGFRAMSVAVTGQQIGHRMMRKLVTDYIKYNGTYTGLDGHAYLESSQMTADTIYCTDVELMAAAKIFEHDIYVYHKYGEKLKWLHFPCGVGRKGRPAIYLDNRYGTGTDGHFDFVLAA